MSVAALLALAMAALPTTGFAGDRSSFASDRIPLALPDLTQLGEALGRGELPLEVLAIGALIALVLGVALALLVGGLRTRRDRPKLVPDGAAAESSEDAVESRRTTTWPVEDADVFQPPDPARSDDTHDPIRTQTGHRSPWSPEGAEEAEAWAAREATIEATRETSAGTPAAPPIESTEPRAAAVEPQSAAEAEAEAVPPAKWSDLPLPYAIAPVEPAPAPRIDIAPARPALGTPASPLVVELHDERDTAAPHHRGPNLPVVAAIGTVAVGVAFSAGAAVGATLGLGVGAAIGLAFAGGAGAAVGATLALLGGRRS